MAVRTTSERTTAQEPAKEPAQDGGTRETDGELAAAGTGTLDALLTDATGPSFRQFLPGKAGLVLAAKLAAHPLGVTRRSLGLARELARIAVGRSEVEPDKKDKRFTGPGLDAATRCCAGSCRRTSPPRRPPRSWSTTPTSTGRTTSGCASPPTNVVDALAPSNIPILNPLRSRRPSTPAGAAPSRAPADGPRPGHPAAGALDGRTGRVHGRRGPRGHPGRGRAADAGLRADPVPPDDGARARGAAADGAADDQQVLHRRPRAGPQHRRALRRAGPAGLHDVLAQPRRAARRLGPGHLRPGGPRRDGRRRGDHRQRPDAAVRRSARAASSPRWSLAHLAAHRRSRTGSPA